MAYITLDELKEILPGIFKEWIWEGDESWEWIFNEIEQKCHIGTKRKGKKWKKYIEDDIYQLKAMVDAQSTAIAAHRNNIDKLTKRVDELSNKVSNLSSSNVSINSKINILSRDIEAAKSMAQTAKQRTDVDYTKLADSNGYFTEAQVAQHIYNRMANRGATREELDSFREVVKKYDATSYTWNDGTVAKKMCETCKYGIKGNAVCDVACASCNSDRDKWEDKNG